MCLLQMGLVGVSSSVCLSGSMHSVGELRPSLCGQFWCGFGALLPVLSFFWCPHGLVLDFVWVMTCLNIQLRGLV